MQAVPIQLLLHASGQTSSGRVHVTSLPRVKRGFCMAHAKQLTQHAEHAEHAGAMTT